MKHRALILIILTFIGCASQKDAGDWCEIEGDSGYQKFVPNTELVSQISNVADSRFKSSVSDDGDGIVWKKRNDGEVVACIPGGGFGDLACDSEAYHFVRQDGKWVQEFSEITMCHKAP